MCLLDIPFYAQQQLSLHSYIIYRVLLLYSLSRDITL